MTGLCLLAPPSAESQGNGIGGYDLRSTADLSFAFDYDGSGKADHLVFYRPGQGNIWILARQGGNFAPVFVSDRGIGGYDLKDPNDRIFPIDFNGDGLSDHLVLYRPGTGIIWILANQNGNFTPVFTSTQGIGGFDIRVSVDQLFAFDATGSGHNEDIVAYRPGTGIAWVLHHDVPGTSGFYPIYTSSSGIGGFDLRTTADRITAYDPLSQGSLRELVIYRPGTGILYHARPVQGYFGLNFLLLYSSTVNSVGVGDGFGGYDLRSPDDRIIAYDYSSNGTLNDLVAYRPSTGIIWILQDQGSYYSTVYASGFDAQTGFGAGIGTYDLRSPLDQVTSYDYSSDGKSDHLLLYRPGAGVAYVVAHTNGTFSSVFTSGYIQ